MLFHSDLTERPSEKAAANLKVPAVEIAAAEYRRSLLEQLRFQLAHPVFWRMPLLTPDGSLARTWHDWSSGSPQSPWRETVLQATDQPCHRLHEVQKRRERALCEDTFGGPVLVGKSRSRGSDHGLCDRCCQTERKQRPRDDGK